MCRCLVRMTKQGKPYSCSAMINNPLLTSCPFAGIWFWLCWTVLFHYSYSVACEHQQSAWLSCWNKQAWLRHANCLTFYTWVAFYHCYMACNDWARKLRWCVVRWMWHAIVSLGNMSMQVIGLLSGCLSNGSTQSVNLCTTTTGLGSMCFSPSVLSRITQCWPTLHMQQWYWIALLAAWQLQVSKQNDNSESMHDRNFHSITYQAITFAEQTACPQEAICSCCW